METDTIKSATRSTKRVRRSEAKKRKLEALLNLIKDEDNSPPVPKRKTSLKDEKNPPPVTKRKTNELSGDSDYQSLKNQLKLYSKVPEKVPFFSLGFEGTKAEIKYKDGETEAIEPLFIEDIYQLLLRSVIGHQSPYPLSWAKLENPQKVTKTVLLVVEGLTKSDVLQNISKLTNVSDTFPHVIGIVSSNVPFASELSTLHMVTDFHIQAKDTYSTMFPKEKDVKIEVSQNSQLPSKLHLLLSPIQMAMENYPFPKSVLERSKSDNYVFTKKSYAAVTKDSPIFAVDCEMCRTTVSSTDLTRIAIVDENLETVYHTLVKPEAPIIDYMTKYSGITKEMLTDVTIKLSDVQQHLQKLLPPDAILCGQSLNCDLHALKMIHPYVIDTSIIFNCSGIRSKKTSLKSLTMTYLNEVIQDSKKGHNPIEDSIAAMKLVKLKLQNNMTFGDLYSQAIAKITANMIDDSVNDKNLVQNSPSDESSSANTSEASVSKPILSAQKADDGFFAKTARCSKSTCLIGDEASLNHYDSDMLNNNVEKVTKSSRRKIIRATLKRIEKKDFIVSHTCFDLSTEPDSLFELNDIIEQLYTSCIDRTMLMVLLSGVDEKNYTDIKSGLFMAVLKKSN